MSTYFLFVQGWNLESALSLCLADDGQLLSPLENRPLASLGTEVGSRFCVVLSTALVGLHEIEMPLLSSHKARLAIPYAVEEHLPQKLSELHCAFDKAFYFDRKYVIAVIEKTLFENLLTELQQANISAEMVTIDWCALQSPEIILANGRLIVRDKAFSGALEGSLIDRYLSTIEIPTSLMFFGTETPEVPDTIEVVKMQEDYHEWAATRLTKFPKLNLCQGQYAVKAQGFWQRRWAVFAGGLMLAWLLVTLGGDIFNIMRLKYAIKQQEHVISHLYHAFFPEATQVISPRFRIDNLIKSKSSKGSEGFWKGLEQFTQAFFPTGVTIDRIQYQGQTFFVSLTGQEIAAIDALVARLKSEQVTVKDKNAVLSDKEVKVTLELK